MATPNSSTPGIRDALADGFRGLLGDAETQSALSLWDRSYATGKPHALIEYVNEVAAALMLPTRQRHEIRMALYRALLTRGIDPTRSSTGAAGRRSVTPATVPRVVNGTGSANASAAFRVFRSVVLDVFRGVGAAGATAERDFSQAIRRHASAQKITDSGRMALEAWAAQLDDDGYFLRLAATEYPSFSHLMYVAACEALGPVLADRVFSSAIAQAETLADAAQFPPRRLL
ncbi:hypothetical protein E4T66_15570 [Sinimarinibacterium sp. CAU 1509]|uniref:hypothetical protein n=1 Tax=Sinimarinibacterium sp. CAU 1509 TaxID=2562283 RepID=UPI0010ABC614|nr:hypothetical protein [Sinimarinibacterium sp. CAU 1509]TJY59003.1 hypothetical protein E4T66_15570 [Sinimarinibacterium sp. CAU 1509]